MVSLYNMHLQIPAALVPPLLTYKRIILRQVVFPNAVNIHQIYLPNGVFFFFFLYFLFSIKTSLVLAGLMVQDQKAIFQLFLKPAFLSKVKQCLFKLPVLCASSPGESILLCQCIAQRKASKLSNFEKKKKKQPLLLVYLSWLEMCLSVVHLPLQKQSALSLNT